MVAGLECAIVIRSKRGPALLTQTRGVDVKAAMDASFEVAALLASHASGSKDDDGSGDNPPGYASGDMPASNDRFRVVYRLVTGLYVMAVAPTYMNIFFSTQLVNSIVHRLCAINRGINLTPEKLISRFPEAYLAVAALLANGGQLKSGAAAAEAAVDSISSEATKAMRQLRKSVANPLALLRGGEKKPQQEAVPLYVGPRSLAEEVDPLTTGTFRLPEDALPPLAYVAPEAPSAAPAAGWDMSGYRLQTLSPTPSEADAAEAAERERELGPDEPIGGDMWTSFADGTRPDAPPIDDLDFPATPTGPRGVWLEELWRCHVVGRDIQKAGLLGQVLGTVPLSKEHLKTTFRLQLPPTAPPGVQRGLRAAQPDLGITVRTDEWYDTGLHVAAFDATFGKAKPVFLQYKLPAVALPPPIQVRFIAVLSEPAEPEAELPRPTDAADGVGQNGGASIGQNGTSSAAVAPSSGNGDSLMEEADLLGMDDEEPGADVAVTMDAVTADAAEQQSDVQSAAATDSPVGNRPPASSATEGAGAAAGAATAAEDATKEAAAAAAVAAAAPAAAPAAEPVQTPEAQPADDEAALATEAAAKPPGRRRLTLVLRYVVNPGSLLPLYSATVDIDLHPHLGRPLKVSPAATWATKQQRVRWRLPPLAPGASGDVKAYFEPDTAGDPVAEQGRRGGLTAAAVEEAVCRVRFTGPPRSTLSGAALEAGIDASALEPASEQNFFGELTAQAELVHL